MNTSLGRVMLTEYRDGYLGVTVDGYGSGASMPLSDVHASYGFLSRPLDPELDPQGEPIPDRCCQALYRWEGGRTHVTPTIDPRVLKQLPELAQGDSIAFAGTASTVTYVFFNAATRVITLGQLAGADAIVLSTPLLSYVSALETLLQQIATAVDAKMGAPSALSAAVASFISGQSGDRAAMPATLAKAV